MRGDSLQILLDALVKLLASIGAVVVVGVMWAVVLSIVESRRRRRPARLDRCANCDGRGWVLNPTTSNKTYGKEPTVDCPSCGGSCYV